MSDRTLTVCGDNHLHIPKSVCYEPFFVGTEDKTIIQGADFNLRQNVKAFDGLGNEIPYTVSPAEIDCCDVGTHAVTYTADNVVEQRLITITESANPVITIEEETIQSRPGHIVYTLLGVSAVDGNGRTISVVCVEGETVKYMSSGTYTLHYRADKPNNLYNSRSKSDCKRNFPLKTPSLLRGKPFFSFGHRTIRRIRVQMSFNTHFFYPLS